jgi:SAM-dependent methyltransferase
MSENKTVFESQTAVRSYAQSADDGLFPSERIAFSWLCGGPGASVLDIGIGAGRTTRFLAGLFETYISIDYSEALIKAASARFPGLDLRVIDARELSFSDRFDAIVFSYNGIDYMEEGDRRRVLLGIARHLRPGGIFVYSTHNLEYCRVDQWMRSLFVREIGFLPRSVLHLCRRAIRFHRQKRFGGYARVNDPGLGFSLLTRYGNIARETSILESFDHKTLAIVGETKQTPTYDCRDSWAYIVSQAKCAVVGT